MTEAENEHNTGQRPMSVPVILAYLVLVILIVGGIWLAGHNAKKSSQNNPTQSSQKTQSQTSPNGTTPDTVKQQGGASGDTQPSPSGTAPGGNNSLLSQ